MLTLPFFEDLLLFDPNSLFIAGFFESKKIFFSWHFCNCSLQGEASSSFVRLAIYYFA